MFSQLWQKIKELIYKVLGTARGVEQALHIKPTISSEMADAIELWDRMYKNTPPWKQEPIAGKPKRVTTLGLPSFIASEKARMCTLEMKSEITGVKEDEEVTDEATGLQVTRQKFTGSTDRAEFLNEQYQNTIMQDIRTQLEYALAKGGMVIKPYVDGGRIVVDYVQADGFYPIAFDASGNMTEAAFVQRITDKDNVYSRLEYHKLDNTTVTIINRAFKAAQGAGQQELGNEIPLTAVPQWADLQPETTIEGVDRLLFAYFKPPIANTIDTYSPLGESVYNRAKDLIKDADEQYSRMLWEFEGGELAIDVDREALRVDETSDGKEITYMPKGQERLFRRLDLNNETLYEVFNPALRDASMLNGLNSILTRIEDVCELARGTIADVTQEARTATEIAVLKQRSYAANALLQKQLEQTLRDVIYIMDTYTTLYNLAPMGDYDVSFEWDDSIQVDKESEMTKRLTLVQSGISSKVEFRMWYYGETEEQAVQALAKMQNYNAYEASAAVDNEARSEI